MLGIVGIVVACGTNSSCKGGALTTGAEMSSLETLALLGGGQLGSDSAGRFALPTADGAPLAFFATGVSSKGPS